MNSETARSPLPRKSGFSLESVSSFVPLPPNSSATAHCLQNTPHLLSLSLLAAPTSVQATLSPHLDNDRGMLCSIMNPITVFPTQDPPENVLTTWSKSKVFSMVYLSYLLAAQPSPPASPKTTLSCSPGLALSPSFCTLLHPGLALCLECASYLTVLPQEANMMPNGLHTTLLLFIACSPIPAVPKAQ